MENKISCVCCGVVINDELANYTPDGDVCESCFMDEYTICEFDNETIVANDDVVEAYVMRGYRRTKIYISPDNADEYFVTTVYDELWHRSNVYTIANGDYISESDYEDDYFTCSCCNDVYHNDESRGEDGDICEGCYRDQNRNRVIYPYNYKPDAIFHGNSRVDTIGTETEIDTKDWISQGNKESAAQYILDQFGTLAYNKEDGSLSYGFEIVTHPATYEYLYSRKAIIKATFDELIDRGFKSHNTDTCGLHIHVGRAGFKSQQAIDNFVYLFEKFYNQVYTFSRRTEYTMRRWAERYGIYNDNDNNKSFAEKLGNAYREKYRIVNLLHSKTLEVRAFKGTLNVETWFASIQFMLVMKHLANTVDNVVNGVTWQSVVKLAKVKGYVELTNYLVKRNLHNVTTERNKKPIERRSVRIEQGTELVVLENSTYRMAHFLPIDTTVTVTNTDGCFIGAGSSYVEVTPVDSEQRAWLLREVSRSTQTVWLHDLAIRLNDGTLVGLGDPSLDVTVGISVF